jgi:hypothetical protein
MEAKVLNLKKAIKVQKLQIAKMEKNNRTQTQAYKNAVERLNKKTVEFEELRNANKAQNEVEKLALKELKNESFTEFRGLFAAFNAIKKSIRENKYGRFHLLTNKVQAIDVLEFVPFPKLVNILVSSNNYGSQSNFNTLFDAVNAYMNSEAKNSDKVNVLNSVMTGKVENAPIYQLFKVATVAKNYKFTESIAHKIHQFDKDSFELLGLSSVYNAEEYAKNKELKAYESAKKKVNELSPKFETATATAEITAG